MFRRRARVLVGLTIVGLLGSLGIAAPVSASSRTQQQGISKDQIDIVALVAERNGISSAA